MRKSMLLPVLICLPLGLILAQAPPVTGTWPTTTPQAVGLSPDLLAQFDADIGAGKYPNLRSTGQADRRPECP